MSCVMFVDHCLSVCVIYFLTIVLAVPLRYTDSDYTFGIIKLFFLAFCTAISWQENFWWYNDDEHFVLDKHGYKIGFE